STIGMAIAISAAATTKIRKTSTTPAVEPAACANVTKLKFTPFSINSMHISMTSTLRRTITPRRPSTKSAPLKISRNCTLSTAPPALPDDRDGGDHRRHEQHRGQLEVEPVLVQERDREGLYAERSLAGGVGR